MTIFSATVLPLSESGASGLRLVDADTDPTVADDGSRGFTRLSLWENRATLSVWVCLDATNGAAVWRQLAGGANVAGQVVWPPGDYVVERDDAVIMVETSAARVIAMPVITTQPTRHVIVDLTGTSEAFPIQMASADTIMGGGLGVPRFLTSNFGHWDCVGAINPLTGVGEWRFV